MMASTVILHEDLVLIVTVRGKDNKPFHFYVKLLWSS